MRWAATRLNVTDPSVKRARSGGNSTVFEIAAGEARWFLKIGHDVDGLIMAAVPGTDLAALTKSRPLTASSKCSPPRSRHSIR
jgi:hypothetical protein